jgi:hypothetical protein
MADGMPKKREERSQDLNIPLKDTPPITQLPPTGLHPLTVLLPHNSTMACSGDHTFYIQDPNSSSRGIFIQTVVGDMIALGEQIGTRAEDLLEEN